MKTDSVLINGGKELKGQISIQGAKNATLPILAASILFHDELVIKNVPHIADVQSFLDILQFLGSKYTFESGTITLNNKNVVYKRIPDDLSSKLRASSLLLGPLLARFGECEIGMPGGCSIGPRPLDIHFDGFERLGSEVFIEGGMIKAKANELHGEFTLRMQSVGATENLIMASVFNKGTVSLHNASKEPEVLDLIRLLRAGGAKIHLHEENNTIVIEGVEKLHPVEHSVIPDRMEAGTFLFAAFATKGSVTLTGVRPQDLTYPLEKLMVMGADIKTTADTITLTYKGKIDGTTVKTAVYPGFPTDLQPQMCVLLTQASKPSMIVENVFEGRYRYIDELLKMNAKIQTEGKVAFIEPSELSGCKVEGYDLRATASMIMAGLCADGVTRVTNLKHLFRGYEAFIEKLQHLGADISYF